MDYTRIAEDMRFLDIMISQLKPNYMHNLNLYLKTLEQIVILYEEK